ncbi:MAG: hypothetical protein RL696_145 [Actinomycetota bacterium]|jgi:hypothetical protein
MKQYSYDEILELLEVSPADELEQAAALAVVAASIRESRKLGRIALGKPRSSWHKNQDMLRNELSGNWSSPLR